MVLPSPRLAGALAFYAQLLATPSAEAQPEPPPPTTPAEPEAPPAVAPQPAPATEAANPAAVPAPAPVAAPAPPPAAIEDEEPKKKKKKKKDRIEIDGRLITRAELAQREVDLFTVDGVRETEVESLDLILDSVRAGLVYDSPIKGVRLELSIEFAGKVKVKDAYAEYKGAFIGARAGFFKAPSLPFESDGRLSLAKADRGFISEILTDRLEIGGRRPGVAFYAFSEEGVAPSFMLGAFQGSNLADAGTRDTELFEASVMGGQSLVARAEIAPEPVELGAYATWRVGTVEQLFADDEPEHFWAGGADAKLHAIFGQTALRVWLDGSAGQSWYSESAQNGWPVFVESRVMAAFRFGGIDKGEFYVEPYAMGAVLDPDLRVTADFAYEAALGANVGFWKQGRLTLEAGLQHTQRNFPRDYRLEFWRDRRSLIAQLAMDF